MPDPADVRRTTQAAIRDFLQRVQAGGMPSEGVSGGRVADPTPTQRLGAFLGKVWDTSARAQAITQQAQAEVPFVLAEQAARLYDENQYAIHSWTDPLDGVSKLLGSLVSLENPISWGEGGMDGPTFSEALVNRGVPESVATLAELFVPDPTGAGKLDDLIPLLGFVPFLRSLRRQPEVAAQIAARAQAPGGAEGFFDDMQNILGAFRDRRHGVDELALGVNPKPGGPQLYGPDAYMTPGARFAPGLYDTHLRLQPDEFAPDGVFVPTLYRDKEAASAQLRSFVPTLDVADANQVVMRTSPEPFAYKGTDLSGLYDMYSRMGFEFGYNGNMVRRPLPVDDTARAAEEAARAARRERVAAAMQARQMLPRDFKNYGDPGAIHAVLDATPDGEFVFLYPDGSVVPYTRVAPPAERLASNIEQLYPDLPYRMEDVETVVQRLGPTVAADMLIAEGVDQQLVSEYIHALYQRTRGTP